MQVGDLVTMPGTIYSTTGIVLRVNTEGYQHRHDRVEVYWIEDGEASWEPVKWLEVISSS